MRMPSRFRNRVDAGRYLAAALSEYAGRPDVLVLGLPRGGVPVAAVVAAALHAPLDVLLVRKVGVPGYSEFAMGAIAESGVKVLSSRLIAELDIPDRIVNDIVAREQVELDRRSARYRGARELPSMRDRIVILVDDGLATGATMEAAVVALRQSQPARIVVAVPVGARATCSRLGRIADVVVCPLTPEPFTAVGLWYDDFSETSDDEIIRLLERAEHDAPTQTGSS
jgi:predicted phosphoribosyltransferase